MKNSKLNLFKLILCIVFALLGIGLISGALVIMYKVEESTAIKALYYIMDIIGAIFIFISLGYGYSIYKDYHEKKKMSIREITLVGIMSAFSVLLYYFAKFNLPFFPPWLDIQVSELPALITGFAYGPYAGSLVILVRFLIKLPASMTAGVGEVGDLILGLILVLISSIYYHHKKSLKNALIGTIIALITSTIASCFINWLVLIPAYINIAGFPLQGLVSMLSYMGNVTEDNFMLFYIFVGVLPFNIFRYIIVTLITFVLYKKTHVLLNHIASYDFNHQKKHKKVKEEKTNIEDKKEESV